MDSEENVAYLAEKEIPQLFDEMMRRMLHSEVRPLNPGKWILRYLKSKMDPSKQYVPPRVWVSCEEEALYDGMYKVHENVNGMPTWRCGANVLYSTASGWWMLADDPAKVPLNKGAVSSSTSHQGMSLPHQVPSWDMVKSGQWALAKVVITDTLLIEEPVSPRRQIASVSPFVDGKWESPKSLKPAGAGLGDIFMPRANTCKTIHRMFTSSFVSGLSAMQGWRCTMEDAHAMTQKGMLLVCDGHGGSDVAVAVSTILPAEIEKYEWPMTEEEIVMQCTDVDDIILQSSEQGGSTACMALVSYDGIPSNTYSVQIGNIGDSRALVWSRRLGRIIFYTIDHKPGEGKEKERLEKAGLWTGERIDGLAVSRAFGDGNEKQLGLVAVPDVTTVRCEEGDIVVIGCDGVFDRLDNESVMATVVQCIEDPAVAAARLCDEALKAGSTDNISCTVAVLKRHALNHDFLPLIECIPGPYTAAWHPAFKAGYERVAAECNTTVAQLVEQRYTDVGIQLANLNHNDSSVASIALRDEFALFHHDKASIELLRTLAGSDRTDWFALWAESEHVTQQPS